MADFADRSVELARKTVEQVMSLGIRRARALQGSKKAWDEARAVFDVLAIATVAALLLLMALVVRVARRRPRN